MSEFSFVKNARLMGRFDDRNPEAPVAGWVNSAIFLTFRGTEIRMQVDPSYNNGNNYLEIVLDGSSRDYVQMKPDVGEYVLLTGLSDEVHTLEVQKRTDILYGSIRFLGFSVSEGGCFLAPPPAKALNLEYFGDSITCGNGDGRSCNAGDQQDRDNGYMSYVGISARLLNANYHTMAVSGIGVVQDAMANPNSLPAKFPYVFGEDTPWDFSRYIADGVIINLGQNDYSNPIDRDAFLNTYMRFVEEIFAVYPKTYVFCCVGTMNNSHAADVQEIVSRLNAAGHERVYYVDLGLILPEVEGWGNGFHPGYQTHYRMGKELADFITEKTGWPQLQRPKTSSVFPAKPTYR